MVNLRCEIKKYVDRLSRNTQRAQRNEKNKTSVSFRELREKHDDVYYVINPR